MCSRTHLSLQYPLVNELVGVGPEWQDASLFRGTTMASYEALDANFEAGELDPS